MFFSFTFAKVNYKMPLDLKKKWDEVTKPFKEASERAACSEEGKGEE